MLDIQFVRDNPELVEEKSKQKGYIVDVTKLLSVDKARKQLLSLVEDLRQKRNELAAKNKNSKPSEDDIAAGRDLKDKLTDLEAKLGPLEKEFSELLRAVPNC
jgi:seryl-tRNA synthetase